MGRCVWGESAGLKNCLYHIKLCLLIKAQMPYFADFSACWVYNICRENEFHYSFFVHMTFKIYQYRSRKAVYRPLDKLQHSFFDFNQPLGMHMNPKNRWIDLADRILKVTAESNTFPLKHTMKADICRKPLGDIMNAPGIIRSVCWRIRSAERE